MAIKKYNPKKVTGSWSPPGKTIIPVGFMDGTFLEVEFDEDAVTTHVGADGTVSAVLNANQMATVTLTLTQTSPTNKELSDQIADADADRLPAGTMNWKDLNGNSVVDGESAFLIKTAKIDFGKSVSGRQWRWKIPKAKISVGNGGEDI